MKKRVGFTASSFDLLHAGHIIMLEEAKRQCDYLIVALQNDPSVDRPTKNKPVQTIIERYIQLRAVRFVDELCVYNTEADLLELLKILQIDVRIIGEEYKHQPFTGREWCEDNGIELYFNKRQHSFSTTELRKRVMEQELMRSGQTVPAGVSSTAECLDTSSTAPQTGPAE